jgi:predicted phage terminase large subunit-like protein
MLATENNRFKDFNDREEAIALDRARLPRSLSRFVKKAFAIVEPAEAYNHNWHIDAVAEHLEAVTRGQIKQLRINVPPGTMKPLDENTWVNTFRGRKRLKDIVPGDEVLTHRGRFCRVTAVHQQGVLPSLKITTFADREVTTALDHPFLTPRGWIQAQHLLVGDLLGAVIPSARAHAVPMDAKEARFLGYMVGDGSTTHTGKGFTNADAEVLSDFEQCAAFLGFSCARRKKAGCTATYVSLSADKSSRVRLFFERHGLDGKGSYTKNIPPAVFAADDEALANFLGAYWTCDATFGIRHTTPTKTSMHAVLTTVSEQLARATQHALLRLGIAVRVRRKSRKMQTKRQGENYVSYEVQATSQQSVFALGRLPGLCSRKRDAVSTTRATRFPTTLVEDEIIRIERVAPVMCRCLTVEGDHSFTANDLAVHNSLLTCVLWPAWEWTTSPEIRWMFASYADSLAVRDSLKMRALVTSLWYQERWPLRLKSDLDTKKEYANEREGFRLAIGISGGATGKHVHRQVVDDPMKAEDAFSKPAREEVNRWYDNTMALRLLPGGSRVVVMQRLHDDDLCGHLSKQDGWEVLCLPEAYEPSRRCVTSLFSDPRTIEGELLWPSRVPEKDHLERKQRLGTYGAAGQLQQRPSPLEGGFLKRAWWKRYKVLPEEATFRFDSWDMSFKDSVGSDFVVGLKFASHGGKLYIIDCIRGQFDFPKTRAAVLELRNRLAPIPNAILIEDTANGPAVIASLKDAVPGIIAIRPDGSKEARAHAASPTIESGNVFLPENADWVDGLIEECAAFPAGAHDDLVDSVTQGIQWWLRSGLASFAGLMQL